MNREKFPEKVPFRLTRMMTKAMEVSGIEGNFRSDFLGWISMLLFQVAAYQHAQIIPYCYTVCGVYTNYCHLPVECWAGESILYQTGISGSKPDHQSCRCESIWASCQITGQSCCSS